MSQLSSAVPIAPRFFREKSDEVASPSERLMLDLVRSAGDVPRADVIRASGLTAPGAKLLIDSLVERGLLKLGPPQTRGRGQPSAMVSLVPAYTYCFGLSIMVDGYRLALMDFSTCIVDERFVTAFPLDLDYVAEHVRQDMEEMLAAAGLAGEAVFGIGLSMTGPFIGRGSLINPPLSLPSAWAENELDDFFARRLGYPVWLDNDANCAAVAESILGIGNRIRNFVYLHFTDGLGGGVIQNGRLMRGAHGNAGELGRIFSLTGTPRPTLEILRQDLAAAGHDFPDIQTMLAGYSPDWPQIDAWIAKIRPALAITIAAIVAMQDPDAIVFGARLPRDLAQRLIMAVEFEATPRRGIAPPNPELLVAESPENATVIGAALLPFKACFFE
jgi:predicted NBD/HSP70 family sugar kinase